MSSRTTYSYAFAEAGLRVFLGLFFLFAGVGHAMNFQMTLDGASILFSDVLYQKASAAAAIATLIVGGTSLVLGWKVRFGALILALFLAPATMVHMRVMEMSANTAMVLNTSAVEHAQQLVETLRNIGIQGHQGNIMKNLVIMMNCLFFLIAGAGPFSLDKRGKR